MCDNYNYYVASEHFCAKRSLLREALFTLRLAKQNLGNPVLLLLLLLLRKVITFYEEDLRVGTGPVRLGSLTHDSEAAPKVTPL